MLPDKKGTQHSDDNIKDPQGQSLSSMASAHDGALEPAVPRVSHQHAHRKSSLTDITQMCGT